MSYEVKITQERKYDETIVGILETIEEVKDLMEPILKAFPGTTITISMIEEPTAEAENNEEEDN